MRQGDDDSWLTQELNERSLSFSSSCPNTATDVHRPLGANSSLQYSYHWVLNHILFLLKIWGKGAPHSLKIRIKISFPLWPVSSAFTPLDCISQLTNVHSAPPVPGTVLDSGGPWWRNKQDLCTAGLSFCWGETDQNQPRSWLKCSAVIWGCMRLS